VDLSDSLERHPRRVSSGSEPVPSSRDRGRAMLSARAADDVAPRQRGVRAAHGAAPRPIDRRVRCKSWIERYRCFRCVVRDRDPRRHRARRRTRTFERFLPARQRGQTERQSSSSNSNVSAGRTTSIRRVRSRWARQCKNRAGGRSTKLRVDCLPVEDRDAIVLRVEGHERAAVASANAHRP